MKANKTMRGQKYPKKPQIQAIKMVTCTLIEKTIFSKFTSLYFIFFSSNSFNINLLSISAVLNNSWSDTGICLARAVSMTQIFNPCIQRLIEHPIKVRAPYTTMRDVRIEAITPFHFPNHYSNQLVK
jgi:hypothetical protein